MTERAAQLHHDKASAHSTALVHFFGGGEEASHHPGLSAPLHPSFVSLRLLAFPKAKVREKICECDGHTIHKLSERRLTADWLAPRKSDCSRLHSKVSSDWLSIYIKATRPVLEIFKMAWYFTGSPNSCNLPTLLTLVSFIRFAFYHLQVPGAGDILNSWNKPYDNCSGFILGFLSCWYVVRHVIAFIFK